MAEITLEAVARGFERLSTEDQVRILDDRELSVDLCVYLQSELDGFRSAHQAVASQSAQPSPVGSPELSFGTGSPGDRSGHGPAYWTIGPVGEQTAVGGAQQEDDSRVEDGKKKVDTCRLVDTVSGRVAGFSHPRGSASQGEPPLLAPSPPSPRGA